MAKELKTNLAFVACEVFITPQYGNRITESCMHTHTVFSGISSYVPSAKTGSILTQA